MSTGISKDTEPKPPSEFDWSTSPLPEVQRRLADLKRIYDKAVTIVSSRADTRVKIWACWSQEHAKEKDPIFGWTAEDWKKTLAQCRKQVADDACAFRDDGAMNRDGTRRTIVCCSQLCMQAYQRWAWRRKLERQKESE